MENVVESKVIVGASGSGKSVKAISDEFFEGLEKIVYVKQRIESGDGFAGLVTEESPVEDRIGR